MEIKNQQIDQGLPSFGQSTRVSGSPDQIESRSLSANVSSKIIRGIAAIDAQTGKPKGGR